MKNFWTYFLLFLANVSVGQKFIFELEPGLKFAGMSFQKNSGNINDVAPSIYTFQNINRVNAFQNIKNTNKFGLEPLINLSLIRINDRWKLGIGLSSYITKSQINLSCKGYSYLTYLDSNIIYTEYISKLLIARYNQFYIYSTLNIGKSSYLTNNVSFGFGINKPSIFNTKNEKEYYQSYIYNQQGYVKSISLNKSDIWGYCQPFMSIKYELGFHNKKHLHDFFTFFVMYVQGFSSQYSFHLTAQNNNGNSIDVSSINKGSGLRIGISKSFVFEKKHFQNKF
ncbi:MAG: hypothetical protein K9I37_10315 [Crocinitomicaceae bacterium]|jgi:hypothetical protein|nr:hypothetical protein [Crocinitomicaceae bacterium]